MSRRTVRKTKSKGEVDRYDNAYSKGRAQDKYDVKYKEATIQRVMTHKYTDEWSDEEGDYKWQIGPQIPQPVFDPTNIEQGGEATLGKLPSRPVYAKPHKFNGESAVNMPQKGRLGRPAKMPSEMEAEKAAAEEWANLDLPLPRVAPHVKATLGQTALLTIWRAFLDNDADESEMILCENMPDVTQRTMNELNYQLPFDEIDYGELEEDDYVEYAWVVGQLASFMGRRGMDVHNPIKPKFAHPAPLPPCCSFHACQRHRGGGPEGLHRAERFNLNAIFNHLKQKNGGRVCEKHIHLVMEEMGLGYDLTKLSDEYWRLHGNDLILSMHRLESLMERIGVDVEVDIDDPLRDVPKWLRAEFETAELMMFKHHFDVIDVDGGGDIDSEELAMLCESLGSRITLEEAAKLIDDYDLDQSGTIDFEEFLTLMFKIQAGTVDMSGNQLAVALLESKQQVGIFDEIEKVSENPPNEYISVSHYGQTPVTAVFILRGPAGSIYEGAKFELEVVFNNGYPFKMPSVRFLNRIFHINFFMQVDGTGYMRHLENIWDSRWNMYLLLEHVCGLLVHAKLSHVPPHMVETVFMHMKEAGIELESMDAFDEEDQALIQRLLLSGSGGEKEDAKDTKEDKDGAGAAAEEKLGVTEAGAGATTPPDAKDDPKSDTDIKAGEGMKGEQASTMGEKDVEEETESIAPEKYGVADHVAALPRLDQMHLNIISLYLCDYNRFYELARRFVDEHATDDEPPPADSDAVKALEGASLEVEAGDSYLVSDGVSSRGGMGIGATMPTVVPTSNTGLEQSAGGNVPSAPHQPVSDIAIGVEGTMNLIGGHDRRRRK